MGRTIKTPKQMGIPSGNRPKTNIDEFISENQRSVGNYKKAYNKQLVKRRVNTALWVIGLALLAYFIISF
tara:strand:+ start:1733 stop:1942 length:210 start_codon:yes stop_codon:yes gene_type:complete